MLLVQSDLTEDHPKEKEEKSEEAEEEEECAKMSQKRSHCSRSRVNPQQLCRDAREQLGQLNEILETDAMTSCARPLLKKLDSKMAELEAELGRSNRRESTMKSLLYEEHADDEDDRQQLELSAFLLQNFANYQPDIVESDHMMDVYPKRSKGKRESAGMTATVEALEDASVMKILSNAGTFDFDAIKFASLPAVKRKPLRIIGTQLMQNTGLFHEIIQNGWVLDGTTFQSRALRFLGVVDGLYKTDALFHGAHHAADVVSTAQWFMQLDSLRLQMHALDHFMSLMSAAIHDVGHPGTNNLFETKTMSPLAVRYNDSSILENYHVSLAFTTMLNDKESNWFEMLPKQHSPSGHANGPFVDMQQYIRRGCIEMVLSTDMAKHADQVQQLKEFLAQEEEKHTGGDRKTQGHKQESLERKLFLLKTVLHAADISNPCRPKDIMLGWVELVIQEFWKQGDEERRLNLPISPLCDRETGIGIIPKGQLGFVKFVIQPFFEAVVEVMPEAEDATDELERNVVFWTCLDQQGADRKSVV